MMAAYLFYIKFNNYSQTIKNKKNNLNIMSHNSYLLFILLSVLLNNKITDMQLPLDFTSNIPQSYMLAMRALQIENQSLKSLIMNPKGQQNEQNDNVIIDLKSALKESKRQLLDKQIAINQLLKEISQMQQSLHKSQEKIQRYQIVIDQLERDKENMIEKITSKMIKENKQSRMTSTICSRNQRLFQTDSKENRSDYKNFDRSERHVQITPCILNLKTPPKPRLIHKNMLQESIISNSIQIHRHPQSLPSRDNEYFKLIAKLRIQKEKLLVIVEHEIIKIQRKIRSSEEQFRGELMRQKLKKQSEKQRLKRQLQLLEAQ